MGQNINGVSLGTIRGDGYMDGYTHKVRFDMHCHTAEGSPDAKVKIVDYTQLLSSVDFMGCLSPITIHKLPQAYQMAIL